MNHSFWNAIDPDIAKSLSSRRDLFSGLTKKAAAVALSSIPVAIGVASRKAFGQSSALPQNIVDVLNFALTLEYLESAFYEQGVATAGLIPSTTRPAFEAIRQHEAEHVALLKQTLGSSAVASPAFDFTAGGTLDPFTNYQTFLVLSQGFEDTGVRAYKGGAPALMENDDILTVALQIHSVEARHASTVRRIRGQKGWITGKSTDNAAIASTYVGEELAVQATVDIVGVSGVSVNAATEAFDEPMSVADVLAIANQFIVQPS